VRERAKAFCLKLGINTECCQAVPKSRQQENNLGKIERKDKAGIAA
jgi:hypothetical protein